MSSVSLSGSFSPILTRLACNKELALPAISYLPTLDRKYLSGKAFLRDMELIYMNSATYNGAESVFTQQARRLVEVARATLDKVR